MKRWLFTMALLGLVAGVVLGEDKSKDSEDSPLVKKTREKLEEKITVKFTDEELKNVLLELEKLTDAKFYRDTTIPGHKRMNFEAKEKPAREVLDAMFKPDGLGYIIHRAEKPGDRYEGWVYVKLGAERGDPIDKATASKPGKVDPKKPAEKPAAEKPANADEQNETLAASRLKLAKRLLDGGDKQDAIETLEQVVKKWPKTKAAEEAKKLIEKHKQ
jgi:hypothetical protein